jgi:purine-binding chemotaxis protein CheW
MSGVETFAAEPREWEALARNAAGGRGADEAAQVLRELLVFLLGGSPYAIPVERVREIVRMRSMTPVPRVPAEIRGVIALRGEVVQVVDLRMRLGLATSEAGRRTRIIVLHGDDDRVTGVLVDAVREVLRVPEDDIRASTAGEGNAVGELFLSGDDFVSILNLDRVLEFRADL